MNAILLHDKTDDPRTISRGLSFRLGNRPNLNLIGEAGNGAKPIRKVGWADGSDHFSHLSDHEREVLTLVADGKTNKEMAQVLGVSVRYIEGHRERIRQKLDIHSVAGLTKIALVHGLVSLDEYKPWPLAA